MPAVNHCLAVKNEFDMNCTQALLDAAEPFLICQTSEGRQLRGTG